MLPFCSDSSVAFNSPAAGRSNQRRSTNIALPLCWPLPQNHSITIPDDIPFPADVQAFTTVLTNLGCHDSIWLTTNPLFHTWVAVINKDHIPFAASSDLFFSLNEANTLHEYQACVGLGLGLGFRVRGLHLQISSSASMKPILFMNIKPA